MAGDESPVGNAVRVAPDAAAGPRLEARDRAPHDLAWAVACALLTALVFLPSLRNGFVETWDDAAFITRNEVFRELGVATIREAFVGTRAHYFAPLTWLSWAVDYRLWGLEPAGYHLTNLVLHAMAAGLAFLIARRVLAVAGLEERAARWAGLAAALAWSLHPLRVESVAWATERKDVLSMVFGLGAILSYLGHARSGAPFWRSRAYAITLVLYGCSLLAKPSLVTLPVVLAILDAYPLRRLGAERAGPAIIEKLPLLALSAAVSVHFSVTSHAALTLPLAEVGVGARVLIALRSILDYFRDLVWPTRLSPFHLHPGAVALDEVSYLVPAALVVALAVAALRWGRRLPAAAAAWLAWLAALAPGLVATQVSWVGRADRFTHLASLAPTLLVAALVARSIVGLPPRVRLVGAAGVGACLVLLGALTVRQISFWRDDVALWTRPIELDPRLSGRVYTERSTARELRGDLAGARADMDAAIAIAASKHYAHMYTLYARRAQVLAAMGLLREAIDDYGRALQTEASPGVVDLLRERAELYAAVGESERSEEDLRLAEEIAAPH